MQYLENLKNALKSLKDSINPPCLNDRERDGAIQRFEFTFELSWKTIRKYFILTGLEMSIGPKIIFREGFREGLILDFENWYKYLEARNNMSYLYNGLLTDEVFSIIPDFIINCEDLIYNIEKKLNALNK